MTKIYYFSGTGNSFWSARKLKSLLGGECELYNIGRVSRSLPFDTVEADALVFVFPVYAFGLPAAVNRFIFLGDIKADYIAGLATFGSRPGGALSEMSKLLSRKGLVLSYGGLIPAVENYIPLFGPPKEEVKTRRLAMQEAATEKCAAAIKAREVNKVEGSHPFSGLISKLFLRSRSFIWKSYKVSETCDSCGLCVSICPVGAIVMREGWPSFSARCEHCQGCLNWCPKAAISSYGQLQPGAPRYTHPDIRPEEMMK